MRTGFKFFIAATALIYAACMNSPRYPGNYQNLRKECPQLDDGLNGVSEDPDYGYTMEKPVRVGGGPKNELKYLHMLLGPNMEFIESVLSIGTFWGNNISLSGYKIIIRGDTLSKPIFIDNQNCRDPKAPMGFNFKEEFKEVETTGEEPGKSYQVPLRTVPE